MSDAEAVFYYIRNAFAHGSFEVVSGSDPIYKLESKKNGVVKAQLLLKQTTLIKLADLSERSRTDIEKLQRKKSKPRKKTH